MNKYLNSLSRGLIAVIFLVSGFGKVTGFHEMAQAVRPAPILDYLNLPGPTVASTAAAYAPNVEGKYEPEREVFCEKTASLARGGTRFHRMLGNTDWKYCFGSDGGSQLFHTAKVRAWPGT